MVQFYKIDLHLTDLQLKFLGKQQDHFGIIIQINNGTTIRLSNKKL